MLSEANFNIILQQDSFYTLRGGSRAAATSNTEQFVIVVNGFQPLTIITKRSILDVAAALDLPLSSYAKSYVIPQLLRKHSPVSHIETFFADLS